MDTSLGKATITVSSSAADGESLPIDTPTTPREATLSTTLTTRTPGRCQKEQHADGMDLTQISPSFKGSKICVAIDVSGSTYGDTLDAEKRATQAICKLIPLKLRPFIKIVPWSDSCHAPVDLLHINSLQSGGGTDPNVFLDDATSRDLLQEVDFWFLMTDGEMDESVVRRFARGIRGYGLHGKACIICIFGEGDESPARCNVSVGISVFAGSPHAAFLYSNIETRKTYILQTKGCFSALLQQGTAPPTLSEDTSWDDLPQTSFENMSRVHIPPSVKVKANEIVLQDDSRLDMAEFFRDLPEDEKTLGQILDNAENLNTVVVTAKLREETSRLRVWLDRVDAKYSEALPEPGSTSFPTALVEPQSTTVPFSLSKLELQNPLLLNGNDCYIRTPHNIKMTTAGEGVSLERRMSRRHSGGYMRRISGGRLDNAADNIGRASHLKFAPMPNESSTIRSAPGFTKPRHSGNCFQTEEFCMDCAGKRDFYCVILEANAKEMTADFPKPGTQCIVAFPLAMGNYAETDILAPLLICDACAYRRVHRTRSSRKMGFLVSLPLLSYSENRTAWLDTVDIALAKRFHISQIPQVLLSILYIRLEKLVSEGQHISSGICEAIKWLANMLLSEVVLQTSVVPIIGRFGIGALHDVLLRSFKSTCSESSYVGLLEYPMDGFVIANAALSNSKHASSLSGSRRKNVVFLKFLYHLTQNFYKFQADNDTTVTRAAKTLVLFNDEPTGPSSLFKWKEIRSLSVYAKDATELRKYFSQRASYKLALTVSDLKVTPFLSEESVHTFERLGVLFNWITSQASHATAVFVHYLLRSNFEGTSVQECFTRLRNELEIESIFKDPADISAKRVDALIKRLPPL